jgi:hypothetical protein
MESATFALALESRTQTLAELPWLAVPRAAPLTAASCTVKQARGAGHWPMLTCAVLRGGLARLPPGDWHSATADVSVCRGERLLGRQQDG